MQTDNNTIFAQSTVPGKAGISVFRASGKDVTKLMYDLKIIKDSHQKLEPRRAYLKYLYDENNNKIDQALVIYFQAPNSFTGEELLEIYAHGSLAVSKILYRFVLSKSYIRLAEPGEFSKLAVLNGKLDLAAAEGLADLMQAETDFQHKQAMLQTSGHLDYIYEQWREMLIKISALLEAYIDFPEEDIPEEIKYAAESQIKDLKMQWREALKSHSRAERMRHGVRISILGKPNVGKSSFINFLTKREVAIVSEIPGTTRDIIETYIDLAGYPIILHDTAGIRETEDIIEKEGVRRALQSAERADIKILMFEDLENLRDFLASNNNFSISEKTLILINKIDATGLTYSKIKDSLGDISKYDDLPIKLVSIRSKEGLDDLMVLLQDLVSKILVPNEMPLVTTIRHQKQLSLALEALDTFDLSRDITLNAEDLREAIKHMSMLVGKIDIEEILGEVFANFCIGK